MVGGQVSRSSAVGVSHEVVEFRTGFLGAGDAMIGIFIDNLPATALGIFVQFAQLHFWILMAVGGAHPGVKGNAGNA
jgi:hypothetical protein